MGEEFQNIVTRRFLTAFISLTFLVPFALAQRNHTPPTPAQQVANKVARLTAILTLTPAQQGTATTIFNTEQSALSTVGASMKTARTALKTAVLANDTAGISTQAAAIGSLTTQEVQATSTANADFYAMLTPTQQTQYNKLGAFGGRGGGFGGRERHN
jgi:Spy/CpxP family protein refolding chaperone